MTLHPLSAQYLCTQHTVPYIGLCTHTGNGGSIHPHNAYIVQHSSLFDERLIGSQLGMIACYGQSLVSHSSTVSHEDMSLALIGTIFLNYLQHIKTYLTNTIDVADATLTTYIPGASAPLTTLIPCRLNTSTSAPPSTQIVRPFT